MTIVESGVLASYLGEKAGTVLHGFHMDFSMVSCHRHRIVL